MEKLKQLRFAKFFFQGAQKPRDHICIRLHVAQMANVIGQNLHGHFSTTCGKQFEFPCQGGGVTIQLMHSCIGLQVDRSPVGTWNNTEKICHGQLLSCQITRTKSRAELLLQVARTSMREKGRFEWRRDS